MKTEKRQTYVTSKGIRIGIIAATLLVPFGLLLAFFGASFSIDYGSGEGICIIVPGVIIAAGIPLYLIRARRRSQAFIHDARVSTAKIVELESRRSQGTGAAHSHSWSAFLIRLGVDLLITTTNNMEYFLTFEFDAQGSDNAVKPLRMEARVSQEFYDSCNLGERTQVRYARAYPHIAYLKGEIGYYQETTL